MHSIMHVMCRSKWFTFLLNSSIFHLKDNKSPSRVILWLMGVLDTNWLLQLSWKPHGIERRAVFKEISRVRQIEETVWKAVWPMARTAQANLKWPVRTLKGGELFVNGHPQTFEHIPWVNSLCKVGIFFRARCYGGHEFDPVGSVQTSGWESVTQTWRWRPRSALPVPAPQGWKVIGCAVRAASLRYATIFSRGFFTLLPCSGLDSRSLSAQCVAPAHCAV